MTRPSKGALDFARRHNLPEPRTREEAIEQMRRVIGLPMWNDTDEARMDVIGQNGGDGEHYTGRTTQTNNTRYDVGGDNNGGREDDN